MGKEDQNKVVNSKIISELKSDIKTLTDDVSTTLDRFSGVRVDYDSPERKFISRQYDKLFKLRLFFSNVDSHIRDIEEYNRLDSSNCAVLFIYENLDNTANLIGEEGKTYRDLLTNDGSIYDVIKKVENTDYIKNSLDEFTKNFYEKGFVSVRPEESIKTNEDFLEKIEKEVNDKIAEYVKREETKGFYLNRLENFAKGSSDEAAIYVHNLDNLYDEFDISDESLEAEKEASKFRDLGHLYGRVAMLSRHLKLNKIYSSSLSELYLYENIDKKADLIGEPNLTYRECIFDESKKLSVDKILEKLSKTQFIKDSLKDAEDKLYSKGYIFTPNDERQKLSNEFYNKYKNKNVEKKVEIKPEVKEEPKKEEIKKAEPKQKVVNINDNIQPKQEQKVININDNIIQPEQEKKDVNINDNIIQPVENEQPKEEIVEEETPQEEIKEEGTPKEEIKQEEIKQEEIEITKPIFEENYEEIKEEEIPQTEPPKEEQKPEEINSDDDIVEKELQQIREYLKDDVKVEQPKVEEIKQEEKPIEEPKPEEIDPKQMESNIYAKMIEYVDDLNSYIRKPFENANNIKELENKLRKVAFVADKTNGTRDIVKGAAKRFFKESIDNNNFRYTLSPEEEAYLKAHRNEFTVNGLLQEGFEEQKEYYQRRLDYFVAKENLDGNNINNINNVEDKVKEEEHKPEPANNNNYDQRELFSQESRKLLNDLESDMDHIKDYVGPSLEADFNKFIDVPFNDDEFLSWARYHENELAFYDACTRDNIGIERVMSMAGLQDDVDNMLKLGEKRQFAKSIVDYTKLRLNSIKDKYIESDKVFIDTYNTYRNNLLDYASANNIFDLQNISNDDIKVENKVEENVKVQPELKEEIKQEIIQEEKPEIINPDKNIIEKELQDIQEKYLNDDVKVEEPKQELKQEVKLQDEIKIEEQPKEIFDYNNINIQPVISENGLQTINELKEQVESLKNDTDTYMQNFANARVDMNSQLGRYIQTQRNKLDILKTLYDAVGNSIDSVNKNKSFSSFDAANIFIFENLDNTAELIGENNKTYRDILLDPDSNFLDVIGSVENTDYIQNSKYDFTSDFFEKGYISVPPENRERKNEDFLEKISKDVDDKLVEYVINEERKGPHLDELKKIANESSERAFIYWDNIYKEAKINEKNYNLFIKKSNDSSVFNDLGDFYRSIGTLSDRLKNNKINKEDLSKLYLYENMDKKADLIGEPNMTYRECLFDVSKLLSADSILKKISDNEFIINSLNGAEEKLYSKGYIFTPENERKSLNVKFYKEYNEKNAPKKEVKQEEKKAEVKPEPKEEVKQEQKQEPKQEIKQEQPKKNAHIDKEKFYKALILRDKKMFNAIYGMDHKPQNAKEELQALKTLKDRGLFSSWNDDAVANAINEYDKYLNNDNKIKEFNQAFNMDVKTVEPNGVLDGYTYVNMMRNLQNDAVKEYFQTLQAYNIQMQINKQENLKQENLKEELTPGEAKDFDDVYQEIVRLDGRLTKRENTKHTNTDGYDTFKKAMHIISTEMKAQNHRTKHNVDSSYMRLVEGAERYMADHVDDKKPLLFNSLGKARQERIKTAARILTLNELHKEKIALNSKEGKTRMLACKLVCAEQLKKGFEGFKNLCKDGDFVKALNEKLKDANFIKYAENVTKKPKPGQKDPYDEAIKQPGNKFLESYQKEVQKQNEVASVPLNF